MRTLHEDVPKTISKVLSTHDWRGRKELIDKVFIEDTKFWHLFFQCINRRELFGVYQMWGRSSFTVLHQTCFELRLLGNKPHLELLDSLHLDVTIVHGTECAACPATACLPCAGFYNFWIGVEYTRVVPDRKNHRVVVDLVETIVSVAFCTCQSTASLHFKPM